MQDNNNPEPALIRKKQVKIFWTTALAILVLALGIFGAAVILNKSGRPFPGLLRKSSKSAFEENFQEKRIVEETGKMSESSSSGWWVNSGGLMEISGGTGKTIQGELPASSKWYKKYQENNPEDTDDGAHPQNIFRLVTRGKWQNFSQEVYFRIKKINLSASENRNESNGILLMSRYEDGDNLYYTGLRVDGSAVIKKKYDGKYYTLKEKKIFSTFAEATADKQGGEYDRNENPNLLPLGAWIGVRSEFRNTSDGNLEIKMYFTEGKGEDWNLAASVTDDGRKEFGKNIISDGGHAGIRTDFMDVEFSDYKITEL